MKIEISEKEAIILRQLVDEYVKTLEMLPESSLIEYEEQLQLGIRLQMALDQAPVQPAWEHWED